MLHVRCTFVCKLLYCALPCSYLALLTDEFYFALQVIMQSSSLAKALHLHLGGKDGLHEANGVFKHLGDVAGDKVQHHES